MIKITIAFLLFLSLASRGQNYEFDGNGIEGLGGVGQLALQSPSNIQELKEVNGDLKSKLEKLLLDERQNGSQTQKEQWEQDVFYASQKLANSQILLRLDSTYQQSVRNNKPDESLNPFGETLFYCDAFNVYHIELQKGNNFLDTIIAGSYLSPKLNSSFVVNTSEIKKISNNLKNNTDALNKKAMEYFNRVLNGIMVLGFDFYK